MKNNQDIELVNKCLKGAESAFKALYELYKAYVYTICVRYGIKSSDLADMVQTIFMQVFHGLEKFDANKSQFKTWMTKIVINQILMERRKQHIRFTALEPSENLNFSNSYESDIFVKMDQKELFNILNDMPAKYSMVFNLHVIDGYSHGEIAEQLNITVGTSRILLHRGRSWAKNAISSFYRQDEKYLAKSI